MFETTTGGGLLVPSRISYDVAPGAFQLRFGAVVTPAAPVGGLGDAGSAGPLLPEGTVSFGTIVLSFVTNPGALARYVAGLMTI